MLINERFVKIRQYFDAVVKLWNFLAYFYVPSSIIETPDVY